MIVNILALGDVVSKAGLDILAKELRAFQKLNNISFTVVNGENASGVGITPNQAETLFDAGADVITLGNHTWGRREIIPYLNDNKNILRPANYAPQVPGNGCGFYKTSFGRVCVINLIGRCDMQFGSENPFLVTDKILSEAEPSDIILVDFHAEATSEKLAMAYYLNGRVSAVWGTHTHVQTSDCGVFSGGTGYITDLGMTGPFDSILGIKPEQSISRFLGNPPIRYEPAPGIAKIEGAIFEVDSITARCLSAEAFRLL